MGKVIAAIAVVLVASVTLAVAAGANPSAKTQRVEIKMRGSAHAWVLTPLTPGAITPDSGIASLCCYTERKVVRDGQAVEINDPTMTLVGKHGILVIRNRIEWTNLPDGWAVASMTWKIIRGTGAYAGVTGGGRGSGVTTLTAKLKAQLEGLLRPS